MRKIILLMLLPSGVAAQAPSLAPLTVEKIMRDPKWIGTSPSHPAWSNDSKYVFFDWNPEKAASDSLYYVGTGNLPPQKTTYSFRQQLLRAGDIHYNHRHTAFVYARNGDIFITTLQSGETRQITQTPGMESHPLFSFNDTKVVYTLDDNLYAWDIAGGETLQLTDIRPGKAPETKKAGPGTEADDAGRQQEWLQREALENSEVLRRRKEERELADSMKKTYPPEKALRRIYTGHRFVSGETLSPDGRFVTYRLIKQASGVKPTEVPDYITESGYIDNIPGRTNVGGPQHSEQFFIYDRRQDTVIEIDPSALPGSHDLPEYLKSYPAAYTALLKEPPLRKVDYEDFEWSPGGSHAVIDIYSQDHKDRWILLVEPATGRLSLLDRQHDSAWIGGPGIGFYGGRNEGWVDDHTYWFQSEATGYSHLYTIDVENKNERQLTHGRYEVQTAQLSTDRKYFYITTNEVHPGEKQFYRLALRDGSRERLTTMTGANEVSLSPDEKWLAILYSYTNKPWELYLQENKPGAQPRQVTHLAQSAEFSSYPWRDPAIITFAARDGARVYARLFRPNHPVAGGPAVLFVHGAGYLQDAHKWWSDYYFREYMFNNLLADNGYTVLEIDYRASAGYGRDWRTAIYRHMGGKDLTDEVDGAKMLVDSLGIDPKRIGIYGGSYGGFITLMAMFTQPGVFAAGAGLRSVTDWSHYNHGYTSSILNEPYTDSIAYYRSSPINFAAGLKGHLLMCHGMVDRNVHFQDIVRLTQKLIELGKNNWELAVYPVEDHGFVEPSSWTDEYKRIFRLFGTCLKP